MENALYRRLLPAAEPLLSPAQYACCRERGTEFLLTTMFDYIHKSLKEGKVVCGLSVDIAGAFDSVPRSQLMRALETMKVRGAQKESNPFLAKSAHSS